MPTCTPRPLSAREFAIDRVTRGVKDMLDVVCNGQAIIYQSKPPFLSLG
jgi:hypothetical protein